MRTVEEFAEYELKRLGVDPDLYEDFMKTIRYLQDQKFLNGYSSRISILMRLMLGKPLTPLTGEDDEWEEDDNGACQNIRCPSVFKEPDSIVIDLEKCKISEDGGHTWYFQNKFGMITFPYYPPVTPEKVYIENHEENITGDPERIKALYEKNMKEW